MKLHVLKFAFLCIATTLRDAACTGARVRQCRSGHWYSGGVLRAAAGTRALARALLDYTANKKPRLAKAVAHLSPERYQAPSAGSL